MCIEKAVEAYRTEASTATSSCHSRPTGVLQKHRIDKARDIDLLSVVLVFLDAIPGLRIPNNPSVVLLVAQPYLIGSHSKALGSRCPLLQLSSLGVTTDPLDMTKNRLELPMKTNTVCDNPPVLLSELFWLYIPFNNGRVLI